MVKHKSFFNIFFIEYFLFFHNQQNANQLFDLIFYFVTIYQSQIDLEQFFISLYHYNAIYAFYLCPS